MDLSHKEEVGTKNLRAFSLFREEKVGDLYLHTIQGFFSKGSGVGSEEIRLSLVRKR